MSDGPVLQIGDAGEIGRLYCSETSYNEVASYRPRPRSSKKIVTEFEALW